MQAPRFLHKNEWIARLSALDYGNGDRVQYSYDEKGRILSATYENGDSVSYAYGDDTWGDLLTGYGESTISYDGIMGVQNYYSFLNGLADAPESS